MILLNAQKNVAVLECGCPSDEPEHIAPLDVVTS